MVLYDTEFTNKMNIKIFMDTFKKFFNLIICRFVLKVKFIKK